ncbi:unnamed protein product [Prunus armeniaca]|uniref:Uncharacterized protein n=1 Tax=Prunus armeniaca TaxID=36596 RepID=A0A6J5UU50_PRUAR|nr:unnamed protein product [Prunus armeniaca]
MRASSDQSETALSRIPNTQDSLKCGQCGKKNLGSQIPSLSMKSRSNYISGTIRGLAIGIFPQKPNLQLRGKRTTSSDVSTLAAGPSTLKQISKPPRHVQKGKPKPSKKGQPPSTSCPYASTSVSTVGSNVVH